MPTKSKTKPATNATAKPALIVQMQTSRWGTARPTIKVRAERDAHSRALKMVLHLIAAEVEKQTIGTRAYWNVNIDHHSDTLGEVYLELADGTRTEADAGMAILRRAAEAF
jgi:hypothetical protein